MNVAVPPADLAVEVGGVPLAVPVLPASGTFGLGHGRILPLDTLGALVPKTVMPTARTGLPPRRLAEAAGGLVNAIGIPTEGIDAFAERTLPQWLAHGPPVIVSIAADSPAAFASLAARFADTGVAALELNLSCPNLEDGGRAFALDADAAAGVIAACRVATPLPLWAKLSPNASAPVAVALAAEEAGADALTVANTVTATAFADGAPALGNGTGGLSGPPLKPINLRLTYEIARASRLPIVGCGGVATLADALDYFAAGATAVAVGTAMLCRPTTLTDLAAALAEHCAATGRTAKDLTRR